MKNIRSIIFFAIVVFALCYQPGFTLGDTIFFDPDGNAIDQAEYETIVSDRGTRLGMKLRDGYIAESVWKDPIKLRKKRIEQWEIMRSHYHPDSLPSKIDTPLTKNK